MSVELWKSIFDWAAVVLVGLTFIAGAGALITGNILTGRQDEKLRRFSAELTQAQTELGKQQERAAKAEGAIASARQQAAEADAKAEGFRLDIAKAQTDAANANRISEAEKLARIKIEEQLAGWRLSTESQTRLVAELSKFPNIPFDLLTNPVETRFMETLDRVLLAAGWNRREPLPPAARPGFQPVTILLDGKSGISSYSGAVLVQFSQSRVSEFGPAAKALTDGLNSQGVKAEVQEYMVGDSSAIHITIGSREAN